MDNETADISFPEEDTVLASPSYIYVIKTQGFFEEIFPQREPLIIIHCS